MDKTLKNIINKTIEKEFDTIEGDWEKVLNKNIELGNEHVELGNKIDEVASELKKTLTEEQKKLLFLIEEYYEKKCYIESRLMFKEGVVLGLTELSYLDEVGLEIALI